MYLRNDQPKGHAIPKPKAFLDERLYKVRAGLEGLQVIVGVQAGIAVSYERHPGISGKLLIHPGVSDVNGFAGR
jgi:hypothetical protein